MIENKLPIGYIFTIARAQGPTSEQYFKVSLKRNNLIDPQILPDKQHTNHLNSLNIFPTKMLEYTLGIEDSSG